MPSTETNPVVAKRCKKLGIPALQGLEDKQSALEDFCVRNGMSPNEVLYVGNDTNDAGCLRIAGIAIIPLDAAPEVVPLADAQTEICGGEAGIREIASALLDDLMLR